MDSRCPFRPESSPVFQASSPISRRIPVRVARRPQHQGGSGRTLTPGYQNRNGQTVIRSTELAGNDHGQSVFVLQCGECGHEYGANGSDVFQHRCQMSEWKTWATVPDRLPRVAFGLHNTLDINSGWGADGVDVSGEAARRS